MRHRDAKIYTIFDITSVSSRAALDEVLARVEANLAGRPELIIWLRGQTGEYLTGDLTPEAQLGICPWRSLRDPSLVPSLCRHLSRLEGAWHEYARALIDWGWYGTLLDTALDIPASERRDPLDPQSGERLGDEWAALELTSVRSTGEVHDYQRAFRGGAEAVLLPALRAPVARPGPYEGPGRRAVLRQPSHRGRALRAGRPGSRARAVTS